MQQLFPAHAGVILICLLIIFFGGTVPRTRGGDPHSHTVKLCKWMSVPRTRGGDPYPPAPNPEALPCSPHTRG